MKILWLDLETTGVNKQKDSIIEFATIYKDTEKDITEEFHEFIKYDEYPENFSEAVKVHGLSAEILAEKGITNKEVYDELIKFLDSKIKKFNPDDKCIVAGYNVKFDTDFVREFFYNNGNRFYGSYFYPMPLEVSAFVMEGLLIGTIPPLPNYKLSTIASYLDFKFEGHSAIEDIKVTEKVYNELKKLKKGGE